MNVIDTHTDDVFGKNKKQNNNTDSEVHNVEENVESNNIETVVIDSGGVPPTAPPTTTATATATTTTTTNKNKNESITSAYADVNFWIQQPIRLYIDENLSDESLEHRRGVVVHSSDSNDCITSMGYDGEVLFWGTHGGEVSVFDVRQNSTTKSLNLPSVGKSVVQGDANSDENAAAPTSMWHVSCCDFSAGTLATGFDSGACAVWNMHTGQIVDTRANERGLTYYHSSGVSAIRFVENSLYTTGFDGYFMVRDLNHNRIDNSLFNCACPLSSMIVQEPHLVFLGSWDGTVRYVDLRVQQAIHEFHVNGPVSALEWDSDVLYCGYGNGSMKSWSLRNNQVAVEEFQGHTTPISSIECRGRRLFSGGTDGYVRVFDTQKGLPLDLLYGNREPIMAMQLVGSDTLYTAAADGAVIKYNVTAMEASLAAQQERLDDGLRMAQHLLLKLKDDIRKRKQKHRKKNKKSKQKKSAA